MPDKFNRPQDPADALYHDVLCGDVARVEATIRDHPQLIEGRSVIDGAWSHGGRRCGAQDDVVLCLQRIADNGADFTQLGPGTFDSAFKAFPRAAALLFELGADATRADERSNTGLHYMAAIGNQFACRILLDHGADVHAKDSAGRTPLDVAMEHNLPRTVHFLREHGADPSTSSHGVDSFQVIECDVEPSDGQFGGEVTWYRADRGYGYLRSDVYGDLFFDRDELVGVEPESVEAGTAVAFAVVHDRFGLRATNVAFGLSDGTPLHRAAASGSVRRVSDLLAEGVDKNACNADGETPYRWSVRYGACQEVKSLLLPDGDRKDEQRYPYQHYSEAWAAFYRAVEDNCLAELKAAMDLGLDPNDDTGPEGRPLMQCANFGEIELVEHLLLRGADPNAASEEVGSTPLHIAAMQGCTQTVKRLLAHGADPHARTLVARGEAFTCPYRAETPLHFAAAYGDIEMVNALVAAGADRFAEDAHGATVLDYYRRHRGEQRDSTDLRKVIRGWYMERR